MRIFLDVGAHDGETLQVVRDPKWGFERIVCFEPAPACWPKLEANADSRVELHRFGLWKEDAVIPLYNPGAVGASMSGDKDKVTEMIPCDFRDAALWFANNLIEGDEVYAKFNVEGAEADIINRLVSAGELQKIDHLLVHFDVRKVPTLRDREPLMRSQLDSAGVEYQTADEIQFGGVFRGTRNWLSWSMSESSWRDFRYKVVRRLGHLVRLRLYPVKQAVSRITVRQS